MTNKDPLWFLKYTTGKPVKLARPLSSTDALAKFNESFPAIRAWHDRIKGTVTGRAAVEGPRILEVSKLPLDKAELLGVVDFLKGEGKNHE